METRKTGEKNVNGDCEKTENVNDEVAWSVWRSQDSVSICR